MTTVAITGGSGFLGINLTRHLLAKGYRVSVIDTQPFDYPEAPSIRFTKGDIRDASALRASFDGADIVVHTAAALPLHSKAEIFSVDVDGTRNVFQVAVEQNAKRVIHISSTAVYGVPDHHPLTEEDPMVGVGPYGNAKIQAEEIAQSFRELLPVSILRPKSFIGPERLGVFALLYDWAESGANFPIPGKGENLYQYLDVADLCDAIELCITQPADVVNDTFNIGAEIFGTFKGDFQSVLDLAGHGKKILSIPAMPAIWILRILDKLNLSPLYPWVYETAVKDSFVSIEKAKTKLGFSPKYSNMDALARNFRWYQGSRSSFAGKAGKTHRVPWKQGVLGVAKLLMKI